MSNSRKLIVEIVGDSSKLDRSLRGVESRTDRFGKRMQSKGGLAGLVGGVGKTGLIGAGVAAGSAVAFTALKKVTDAAKEAQVAQAGLNQAFASAGVSSLKAKKNVDATVQSLSRLSGIDDEEVSRNFANLLRTTGSVQKATKDLALATDIARARHISLAAASKVVEKAENGQLRGLKSLGVQIDKNTTATEAIDRAQRKFAGSAEAYGKTAAGAQDRLNVAFENVQERLGQKLLPILTRLSLKLIEFIDWSERNWPRFAKAIGDAYRTAKPYIDNTISTIKAIAGVFQGVVKIIDGIANGKWGQVWAGIKQVAVKELDLLYHAFLALPLKITRALSGKALEGLKAVGRGMAHAIVEGFQGAVNRIVDLVNSLLGKLKPIAGLLGKVGIDVKVPKIGHVGEQTRSQPRIPGVNPNPERRISSVASGSRNQNPIHIHVDVDGKQMAEAVFAPVTNLQIRNAQANPLQKRG